MSDSKKFKPGNCTDCLYEVDGSMVPGGECYGCIGTWGTEREKLNFVPKPEFVLEDEGEIPRCRGL